MPILGFEQFVRRRFPSMADRLLALTRPVRLRHSHPARRDPRYFDRIFRRLAPYNVGALQLGEGLTLGRFADREFLVQMRPGDLVECTIYAEQAWEPQLSRLADLLLRRSPGVVLDIGANVGASTLPLAARHPDCQFYCFEPHPVICGRLRGNLALNRLGNAHAMNLGVTDQPSGPLEFYAQRESLNMGLSGFTLNPDIGRHDVIPVETTSVDGFVASLPGEPRVSLIKVDTQGHESRVLQGARATLKRDRPAVLFEFEDDYFESDAQRRAAKDRIHALFDEAGYRLYSIQRSVDYYPRMDIRQRYNGDVLALHSGAGVP